MSKGKSEKIQLGEVQHIAIAVRNVEESRKRLSKLGFEFGEIAYGSRSAEQATLRGKPIAYKLRESYTTNMKPKFEVEETIEGKSCQKEFIEEKGEAVQHIAFHVEDLDAEIAKWKKNGVNALQVVKVPQGRWAMMDTMGICGFHFELIEKRKEK